MSWYALPDGASSLPPKSELPELNVFNVFTLSRTNGRVIAYCADEPPNECPVKNISSSGLVSRIFRIISSVRFALCLCSVSLFLSPIRILKSALSCLPMVELPISVPR